MQFYPLLRQLSKLTVLFALTVVAACKSNDPAPSSNNNSSTQQDCQRYSTCVLTITNNNAANYRINYEDATGQTSTTVNANRSVTIDAKAGSNFVTFTQLNNIVNSASTGDLAYNIAACGTGTLTVPSECANQSTFALTIANPTSNSYNVTYSRPGGNTVVGVGPGTSTQVQALAGSGNISFSQVTNINSTYGASSGTLAYSRQACQSQTVSIPQECVNQDYGYLTITSNSGNPYRIEVNGSVLLNSMPGRTTQNYTARSGNYSITATQLSGYVFSPTVVTRSVSVSQCQTTTFVFP